jgi:X-Pro dipeptidyl-peptidase
METVHLAAEEAGCTHTETQLAGIESAATGDKGPYWQVRDYNAQVERVRAPVFLVHGLQDWNVKPDHVLPWAELLREKVPVKMWLGQWAHDYPNHNRYREEWSRADWNVTLLRWFDHWLKGIDTGIMEEPMVDVQDSSGVWRHEADWPPQRAAQRAFHLASGALAGAPAEGSSAWVDAGLPIPAAPGPGAAHYAFFVTEPLAEPLRIAGQGVAQLRLEHSAAGGTVAVTLWDLAPDGEAHRINWGFFDLPHRHGLEQGQAVEPGEWFDLDVPLFPQDDVLAEGHRLAITLSGNDPPCQEAGVELPLVPVGGGPLGLVCPAKPDAGPTMQPAPSGGTTTVLHEASRLLLPIVPDIAPMDPQPPPEAEDEGAR